MTDRPEPPGAPAAAPPGDASAVAVLARLADEVLPALVARLDVSALGELEVRHAGWRVRLRRGVTPSPGGLAAASAPATSGAGSHADPARGGATSPAVGYYLPSERTPVGRAVAAGDVLGWVEVLGVRHEVVAPRDGVVGRHLAEGGQAVEYGQELVVVDGARRASEPGGAGDAPAAGAGAGD